MASGPWQRQTDQGLSRPNVARFPSFVAPTPPKFGPQETPLPVRASDVPRTGSPIRLAAPAPTTSPARAQPITWPNTSPPTNVMARAELRAVLGPTDHQQAHPASTPNTGDAAHHSTNNARTSGRQLVTWIARGQVAVLLVLLIAAPALMLSTGWSSNSWAFALHGIAAAMVLVIATLAVHKCYSILRGNPKSWTAFAALLKPLALTGILQLATSMWLLWHYHAPAGAGHQLLSDAALVDQLAMQFKVFAGAAAIFVFIAAWRSSANVRTDRLDDDMRAPAILVVLGWTFMLAAATLGTAIAWVASP